MQQDRLEKFSKYNVVTTDKKGNVLLTNTISNVLLKVIPQRFSTEEIMSFNKDIINAFDDEEYKFLLDSGVLVNGAEQSVDMIYENTVKNNKRLDIVILTTNQCNFSCVYCFQKRESFLLNENQYDAIVEFIDKKIDENGYENVKIRWFGGEPLLGLSGIRYFSKKINELKKKRKFTYGCGIITNGYLLDVDTFKVLYKNNVVTYQISIDGLPDVKHRLLKNGESSFEHILTNLKAIRDQVKYQMFSITIRINFTKELVQRADEIVEIFYKEFGHDRRFSFSFIPVFDWSYSDSDFMKAEQLREELIHEKDVAEIMKKYSDRLDFKAWTNLLYAHNDCWAGTRHGYTIDANGDILKCDFKLEGFEDNKVGNISQDGRIVFDFEKEKKWIFESPLKECYNCNCFPLCLSTSCGAARIQGIMHHKCISFRQRVLDNLEIESYNTNDCFKEIVL